jgi:uncharacterized membrane protein
MLFAAFDDTPYRVVLLLHILAVVVAFGPLFFMPLVARAADAGSAAEAAWKYLTRIGTPALVLAGFFGMAMIGMSDKTWKFSQGWVSAALLIWLIDVALFLFVLLPAERKTAAGDADAERLVPMFTGIIHLSLLVVLYLMIWKPGR